MRRLTIREEAEQDIRSALAWYQLQKPGLELEFLEALDETLSFLLEKPRRVHRIKGTIMSFPMGRFPFSIIHASTDEELLIIRVYHQKRNPRTRFRRLKR
ncbi:MAG: type II toxin-antitoxin system RelE/ParE family toxin [Bacteroidetes bacterium]|nr:type II toxin-antitoxin system RelE/ParE family toxin [Bacteroidota bacterium]